MKKQRMTVGLLGLKMMKEVEAEKGAGNLKPIAEEEPHIVKDSITLATFLLSWCFITAINKNNGRYNDMCCCTTLLFYGMLFLSVLYIPKSSSWSKIPKLEQVQRIKEVCKIIVGE